MKKIIKENWVEWIITTLLIMVFTGAVVFINSVIKGALMFLGIFLIVSLVDIIRKKVNSPNITKE